MPDKWLPGATHDPGRNAGYNSGFNSLQLAVAHFTVGSDSRGIARQGFFHFLVHQDEFREGGCTQYAEIDAVTWHAGGSSGMPDANDRGPGIEFERMVTGPPGPDGISEAEPLTPNQIRWGQRIAKFCAEWGIPAVLYDGPRYGARDWHGWVNHHDLDKDRSDGLTIAEWNLIISPGGNSPKTRSIKVPQVVTVEGVPFRAFLVDNVTQKELRGEGTGAYGIPKEAQEAIDAGALPCYMNRFEFDGLIIRTLHAQGDGRNGLCPGSDLGTFPKKA
jgi:hypothetical protein